MGELFDRYFRLLAGRLPGAEYGVIATLEDDTAEVSPPIATEAPAECLCPA